MEKLRWNMGFISLFKKYIVALPDLRRFGYFAGNFVFNFYGKDNPIRVCCTYSNRSIGEEKEESEEYLFVREIFPKKPNVECLEIQDKFLLGYVPDFPLVQSYVNFGFNILSLQDGKEILTLVNLKKERKMEEVADIPSFYDSLNDEKLRKFFNLLLTKNPKIGFLPIFSFSNYFPTLVNGWKLVTVFLGYSGAKVDNNLHLISNVQGNYKKNSKYLNLILQSIYKFSEGKVNIMPKGKLEKFEGKEIFVERVNFILNLSYYNAKENFSIRISNNQTTKEVKMYEEDMRELLSVAIKNFEKYSCEKHTQEFIEFSKRLM